MDASRKLDLLLDEENVRVIVRVRPLSSREIEKGCKEIVHVDETNNGVMVQKLAERGSCKSFRFDGVFAPESSQAELFNQVARPIIENVIQGYNGTIFAYGQTGTGKTFTMEGDRLIPELKGIIPNSFAQIFSHIAKESENSKFLVRVSYLEIYNEEVRDLLGKDYLKKLDVKEHPETGVYVKDLSSFVVRNEADMERILKAGNRNRSVGSTNMNIESSRSHAIFSINVECSSEVSGERTLRMGKLNLVDLAGSERISKTKSSGQQLKEGAKINLSLSCLGNVIAALVEQHSHIPYRSSKLTRLLQDSLGGNSKTVMIANVGPADYNYEETISTLRYADRAKQIKNHARINEDPKDALLRKFEKEIEDLRRQLEQGDFGGIQTSSSAEEKDDEYDGGHGDDTTGLIPDEETLMGIKGEIESQERLSSAVKTETEGKRSALQALKQNVVHWKHQQEQKLTLEAKLKSIQKKIMVGGENLLDKSQEQETFLQNSMAELQQRRNEQLKLQSSLTSKIAEKTVFEEKILQLQLRRRDLSKESKKAWKILQKEQLENQTMMEEQETETEALLMEINRVSQENKKTKALLDQFIPAEALTKIKESMTYNEESRSWDVPCIAYAGNHVEHVISHCPSSRGRMRRRNLGCMYKSLEEAAKNSERLADIELEPSFTAKTFLQTLPRKTSVALNREDRRLLLQNYAIASSNRRRKNFDLNEIGDNESGEDGSTEEETPVVDLRKHSHHKSF